MTALFTDRQAVERLADLRSAFRPTEVEGADLDQRLAKLKERFDRLDEGAPRSPLLVPATEHFPLTTIAGPAEDILGRITPLLLEIDRLTSSAVMVDRPIDRAMLSRARQIVTHVHESAQGDVPSSFVRKMLPLWQLLTREAEKLFARVGRSAQRRQRRMTQMQSIREIHSQLLAGAKPRIQIIAEIAGRVLEDVDADDSCEPHESASPDSASMIAAHAVNVAHLSAFIASRDPRWRESRLSVTIASLLADVGMLRSAGSILQTSEPLTLETRDHLHRHPIESSVIAERIQGLDASILAAVAYHHERLDGSGYPEGRAGDAVPVIARIIAAADTYAALRSHRPHRLAISPPEAMIRALGEVEMGRLDSEAVRRLLDLSLYPVGSIVEMSRGEIAEVVATQGAFDDPTLAALPVVQILIDPRGRSIDTPTYCNLAQRRDQRITRMLTPAETFLIWERI